MTPISPISTNIDTHYSIFADESPQKDIFRSICSYLRVYDLVQLGTADRHLYSQIFLDPFFWNIFLRKYLPRSCIDSQLGGKESLDLYKHLARVEHNMRAGKFKFQRLTGHRGCINCLLVHGDWLISAASDRTIKIWNLKSRKELKTLVGHLESVDSLLMLGNQLISTSIDGVIKIWDLNHGKELQTLKGHKKWINTILMHEGQLISASSDSIKVWDLISGEALKTFTDPQNSIGRILMHKGQLIAELSDYTIKIWDFESGKVLKTLSGHRNCIRDILVHGNQLISVSDDCTIKIWNLDTREESKTLIGHQSSIRCILVHGNQLISASDDCTIKIWDLETGKELQTFECHQRIKNILVQGNQLISASDYTIKIWDLNSGKEVKTLVERGPEDDAWINTILMHRGRLISASANTIEIWDFSFPPLSSYSKQVVEENLVILEKMAYAELTQQERLAETLDPDFRQRLILHAFNLGTPSLYSAPVILRVQTEVCVEALLHAIHDEDQKRVSHLLNQLVTIDVQNTEIYNLLWEVCGSDYGEEWGEYAFHNKEGLASVFQKERATIAFKDHLENRWSKT
ncbi:MAG: WD40 repeat domain-containing protein [Rhabdochlamydiaceae bacterium]